MHSRAGAQQDLVAEGNGGGFGGSAQFIKGYNFAGGAIHKTAVAADIGIDLLWPMITNAYGVGELSPRFVNSTLRKIIHGEPLQFTAATQNYDFIYVTDVAKAFYLVAKHGKPFSEYMIGSGGAKPLREFILEMQQALAPDVTPIFGDIPFTGIDMPLSTFDITALREDCGFEAEVSFAEGTRLTLEWLKTQE
jgi:nucleoside-diphosphate-sugar epimerase